MRRKWFAARDVFLGINGHEQNLAEGLQLASQCDDEDAHWLCDTFIAAACDGCCGGESVAPTSPAEARAVFLHAGPTDPRALAFAALVVFPYKKEELRQAAELGLAFAQGFLASLLADRTEKRAWAFRAAEQGDPQGMCIAAEAVRDECGASEVRRSCAALALLRGAAERGWMEAQVRFGMTFSWDEPERYTWMAKGRPFVNSFMLDEIPKQLEAFDVAAPESAARAARRRVVNEIGRALCGHVDVAEGNVFGRSVKQRQKLLAAERAVQLYQEWCERWRNAALCWVLVGRRLGICRDVVGIIARMVWAARKE